MLYFSHVCDPAKTFSMTTVGRLDQSGWEIYSSYMKRLGLELGFIYKKVTLCYFCNQ